MKIRKNWALLITGLLLVLGLTACAPRTAATETTPFGTETALVEASVSANLKITGSGQTVTENIQGFLTELPNGFPAPNGGGAYFVENGRLYFYDFSLEERYIMCAQAGCRHIDETCAAWMGGANDFAEYGGQWYSTLSPEMNVLQLQRTDPETGARKILCTWEGFDSEAYTERLDLSRVCYAHGSAYVLYTKTVQVWDSEAADHVEDGAWELHLERVNLKTGQAEAISIDQNCESIRFLGASESYAAVIQSGFTQEPMSYKEYAQQTDGDEEAYYAEYMASFYEENWSDQLQLYNFATGKWTTVASSETDAFIPTVDPAVCCNDIVVYQLEDTVYLLDLADGTSTALFQKESIVNYWIMDQKVFCITRKDDLVEIFAVPISDGIPVKLENGGSTDAMVFGIYGETPNEFLGNYQGGQYWIAKDAFYADNYDSAKPLN